MSDPNTDLNLQFHGFLKSQFLWHGEFSGLKQIKLQAFNKQDFKSEMPSGLRLGKRVERFVSEVLRAQPNLEILIENYQIQSDKITLGELDCLLKQEERVIHLEIIYKFYLIDPSIGTNELEHCIGPNRKDNLVKKLEKLKHKQFPMLYKPETQPLLDHLQLSAEELSQQVYFKAQLFTPLDTVVALKQLNPDCVQGFYCNLEQLDGFSDCLFFIPSKWNWLQTPHAQVDWLNFHDFKERVKEQLAAQRSPLCWIQGPDTSMEKCFVIWW